MKGSYRLVSYLAFSLGILFLIMATLIVVMVNNTMKQQALAEAESKARLMLDKNLAVHTYFSQKLKPTLFQTIGPLRSPDYFEPIWMSSTYAVREMDQYFHHFNSEPYYYKECAINARSPENEADDYEREFLKDLSSDPGLIQRVAILSHDGQPFFTVLRRGEEMESSCLRCHSTPDKAPGDLVVNMVLTVVSIETSVKWSKQCPCGYLSAQPMAMQTCFQCIFQRCSWEPCL